MVAVGCYGLGSVCSVGAPALPLLEQAVEHASAMGMMGSQSLRVTVWEKRIWTLVAWRSTHCALKPRAAQTHKERTPGMDPPALSEVAAQCHPPEVREAETFYRQSLALSDELACGRSWPTVTSALGPYIASWDSRSRRAPHCPPLLICSSPWE